MHRKWKPCKNWNVPNETALMKNRNQRQHACSHLLIADVLYNWWYKRSSRQIAIQFAVSGIPFQKLPLQEWLYTLLDNSRIREESRGQLPCDLSDNAVVIKDAAWLHDADNRSFNLWLAVFFDLQKQCSFILSTLLMSKTHGAKQQPSCIVLSMVIGIQVKA